MTKHILATLTIILLLSDAYAQSRSSGQLVAPLGWENEDSIRNAALVLRQGEPYNASSLDSLHFNIEETFSYRDAGTPYDGIRKGYISQGPGNGFKNLTELGGWTRQRTFFPAQVPYGDFFFSGYYWRYLDSAGYSWHDFKYDSNDISPYAVFKRNDAIVKQPFLTREFNVSPDTVSKHGLFGHEGRVILGQSDTRLADKMLLTTKNFFFTSDSAQQFSLHLDFSLDTSAICIDSSRGIEEEELPLLRVQVLYKRGYEDDINQPGWDVLPFMPFRTASHPNNAGWYEVMDEVITKADYRNLDISWRAPDTINGQSVEALRGWGFKQFHKMLPRWDSRMRQLNKVADGDINAKWDHGARHTTPLPHSKMRAEDIVGTSDTVAQNLLALPDPILGTKGEDLIEIRILSTYRTDVRIRSLTWQDTIVDKFLYRKRTSPTTTHSLNPDGTLGGFDDSMTALVNAIADLNASVGGTREIMFNDIGQHLHNTGIPAMAYVDYMLSKRGWAGHPRPQEGGGFSLSYRRERMSFDGQPPSVMENQTQPIYSNQWDRHKYNMMGALHDVMPGDYLYFGHRLDTLSALWPHNHRDTMLRTIIGRRGAAGDNYFKAYHEYHRIYHGFTDFSHLLRGSTLNALRHPKNKRFAIQQAPSGLAVIQTNAVKLGQYSYFWPLDTVEVWNSTTNTTDYFPSNRLWAWYSSRPTTPEELRVQIYMGIANGITAFLHPQVVDHATPSVGFPNVFGISKRTSGADPSYLDRGYNWGHRRTNWSTDSWTRQSWNDLDSLLPEYYLGYSNGARAWQRTFSKLNQIYAQSSYSMKQLEWLDTYSSHLALVPPSGDTIQRMDTLSYSRAFLKVVSTQSVEPWARGNKGEYIDLPGKDSAYKTFTEVGLFRDNGSTYAIPKGYAALVVNTRTWPSLRDPEDSLYFNEGLTGNDRSASTFGDIDVRKVYMKIDPTKMHDSMKSTYYVVREIWHPDTTWLVHKDSQFAVYIKPGDAKFFYIQKGIAIHASPTAFADAETFGYNNGRRVAERMGGTKQVVVYVRDSNLYVSYPGEGRSFEGYHENSAGDAVASGYEEALDISDTIHINPSVCVAQNDTGVAIASAEWQGNKGAVAFWYQSRPDAAWKRTELAFVDAGTLTQVRNTIPVLTPINDSLWFVASRDESNQQLRGVAVRIDANGQPWEYGDWLYISMDTTARFPTVASRPLPDSMWPIRIAWQQNGSILRRAIMWWPSPTMSAITSVSGRLATNCTNQHPSIAMAGHMQAAADSQKVITEDIVWEALLTGKKYSSNGHYYIPSRGYTQRIDQPKGQWGIYTVFRPDTLGTEQVHWPVISSSPRIEDPSSYGMGVPSFEDRLRIVWHNKPNKKFESRHWVNKIWHKMIPDEIGMRISQSQTTDSIQNWTTTSMVNPSMAWVNYPNLTTGKERVRITRGWANRIAQAKSLATFLAVQVYIKPSSLEWIAPCTPIQPLFKVVFNGLFNRYRVDRDSSVLLAHTSPDDYGIVDSNWNDAVAAIRSDTFSVVGGDSIWVERHLDTLQLVALQAELIGPDHLTWKLVMLNISDSSWVATLDSIRITSSGAHYPGSGLDPDYATVTLPQTLSERMVIIAARLERGMPNQLEHSVVQVYMKEDDLPPAEKRAVKGGPVLQVGKLKVSVQPNPFNSTTLISVSSIDGMPTVIELSDVMGRKLQTLHDGELGDSELHLVLEGHELPPGTYFVRVLSGGEVLTRKLQLVK